MISESIERITRTVSSSVRLAFRATTKARFKNTAASHERIKFTSTSEPIN